MLHYFIIPHSIKPSLLFSGFDVFFISKRSLHRNELRHFFQDVPTDNIVLCF